MPYPNEHAARLRSPNQFRKGTFVRKQFAHNGKTYYAIMGKLKKGNSSLTIQAFRYPVTQWSAADAKAHATRHDETVTFEPATGKTMNQQHTFPRLVIENDQPGKYTASEVKKLRFRKDVIPVGTFYNNGPRGWRLDVTQDRMRKWVDAFAAMRRDGIDVPILKTHVFGDRDENGKAVSEQVLGRLEDLRIEGDTLYAECAFNSDESADLAVRVGRTSPGILRQYMGGNGKQYGEVIEHLAITPRPVVPGQKDFGFLRIAAARDDMPDEVPVFVLQRSEGMELQEFLQELQGIVGLDELSTDDALDRIKTVWEERDKVTSETRSQLEALQAEIEKLKKANRPKELDPDLKDQLQEAAEDGFDQLVSNGKIVPAVAAELKQGLTNEFCLSRSLSGGQTSIARLVINALKKNDPVKLGEQTGLQRIALSRSDEPSDFDPEVFKAMEDDLPSIGD